MVSGLRQHGPTRFVSLCAQKTLVNHLKDHRPKPAMESDFLSSVELTAQTEKS